METVIYADVLFFINFAIDCLCLTLGALLPGRRLRPRRLLLGGALGGLYAVGAVALTGLRPVFAVTLHLCAAFLICLTAFEWRGWRSAAADTVCFFAASALLGGVLYAVYTLCGAFVMYNGAFYAELSPPALLASAAAAASILAFCLVRAKTRARAKYAELRFRFRGKDCLARCLCDSGNLLVCPYTALPVAVLGRRAAERVFSKEELQALKLSPALSGVRPLPASGIGGETLLPSFVPESAEVKPFGEKRFKPARLCVALKLSGTDFAGSDGIVPSCVL